MNITISKFLSAIVKDENEIIYLRSIGAKGISDISTRTYKTTWKALSENIDLQNELRKANKNSGIYFVVNSGGNAETVKFFSTKNCLSSLNF